MKKLFTLFIIIDFVFIGLVLTLSSKNSRMIATDNSLNSDLSELTEGQKNKWLLVKTFRFENNYNDLVFSSDKLQMICETSSLIQLHYSAQNIAIAGNQPQVIHSFSCDKIKKDQSQFTLTTPISEFLQIHQKKITQLDGSELRASSLYSDEELPKQWKLSEIKITGPNTFTINEFEIEKVLLKDFIFEITSAK